MTITLPHGEHVVTVGDIDETETVDGLEVTDVTLDLDPGERPAVARRVRCSAGGKLIASVRMTASRGGGGSIRQACLLTDTSCLVVVGNRVAALRLPDLELQWHRQVDVASCFGVHALSDPDRIVTHGEVEIRCLTLTGQTVWSTSGLDIFTGPFVVDGDALHVSDFDGRGYEIDASTGRGRLVGSEPGGTETMPGA